MAEQLIEIAELGKSFSVDVAYGSTFKDSVNRSFANASPCCHVELKQDKRCSGCNQVVANNEVTEKMIKIGKQKVILPAERLKQIESDLESQATTIRVSSVLPKTGFEFPVERVDGAKWCYPTKKRVRDFIELRELCREHVLIAEMTIKSNTYEVAIVTRDNKLVIVKFASEARMNQVPTLDGIEGIEISKQILDIETKLLSQAAKDTHDFTKFVDKRAEQVDLLIEKVALGEEVPVLAKREEVVAAKTDDAELERLKALLVKR